MTSIHTRKIRLGISSCLLGNEVRHDGGHKRDTFLIHGLGPWVEWVPVCPEAEAGMGIPREPVRLLRGADGDEGLRMVGVRSAKDWTADLRRWSEQRSGQLASMGLHGFVLTKNSPSCGVWRVKVYDRNMVPSKEGRGLWAEHLHRAFPLLPIEEDGRLCDARIRENFADRIFAHERWTRFLAEDGSRKGLVRFHTVHKLTLLAHSPDHYRKLGRLVAGAGKGPLADLRTRYGELFMETLAVMSTPGRLQNVLEHIAGFLKGLPDADRAEIQGLVADHRNGLVPLVTVVTMLRHHLRKTPGTEWALDQTFLDPYPRELALRSRV